MADLLANSHDKPGRGRPVRVPPGSEPSIRIRQYTRGAGAYISQVEAANEAYKRCRNGRTSTKRHPLGELNATQVHNITQGKAHSAADYIDSKPISRLRGNEKPPLKSLDLKDRQRFCKWILSLDPDNTILIGCDETPIDFGGTGHTHISAPKGSRVFADQASDPRFKKMQWDAASNDCRITRPCIVWQVEDEEPLN